MAEPRAIEFVKMSGGGNDFVVIDDRSDIVADPVTLARRACTRRLSIGADGLILLERSERATFRMRYYNADGSLADFCANGTRCAARFAHLAGMAAESMTIETGTGLIEARMCADEVELRLGAPARYRSGVRLSLGDSEVSGSFLVAGVPHFVIPVDRGIWDLRIADLGPAIRFHPDLGPEGANVDWVQTMDEHRMAIRTWERGVEGETLSCGSGVIAASAACCLEGRARPPLSVLTRSGIAYRVEVRWDGGDGKIESMTLQGDARVIYRSAIGPETLEGFDPEWVARPCETTG